MTMVEIGTRSGEAGRDGEVASAAGHEGPEATPASVSFGRAWRNVLTIGLLVSVIMGTFAWTDDAWPFAPFRMFAAATKPTGRVVRVTFQADLAGGTRTELDALDFGLRRAEVEGQLDTVSADPDKLGDLARSYNSRVSDPGEQIERLEMVLVGSRIVDGVPTEPIVEVVGEWGPE